MLTKRGDTLASMQDYRSAFLLALSTMTTPCALVQRTLGLLLFRDAGGNSLLQFLCHLAVLILLAQYILDFNPPMQAR